MNKYDRKILKWFTKPMTPEEVDNFINGDCVMVSCFRELEKSGLIKHVDQLYQVENREITIPADLWIIEPYGLKVLQDDLEQLFWSRVPIVLNYILSLAAVIISVIALLKT